jgi:hypothetical protein
MYGTTFDIKEHLLDKVISIGKILNATTISISTDKDPERKFYKKKGFDDGSKQPARRPVTPTEPARRPVTPTDMIANLNENMVMVQDRGVHEREVVNPKLIYTIPPSRGGKRKTTSQKSKRKNKQRKITKKRNRISSKKRKYYRP